MTDAQGERQQIIDGFVARLVQLRTDAGDPSFRSMAKRSGAISHATLHDAVQGTRLPSWETTAEFAKACGEDPATLRADWEAASAALCGEGAVPSGGEPDPARSVTGEEPAEVRTSPAADDHFSGGPSRSAIAFGVGGLIAGLFVGFFILNLMNEDEPDPASAASTPSVTKPSGKGADKQPRMCRTNTNTHVNQPPRTPGDGGELIEDVTMKDCSTVPADKTVTKIWRYKNDGSLTWEGRSFKRIDPYLGPHDCKAPEEVPIPRAKPGQVVKVKAKVKTPSEPTNCYVRYMIQDEEGNYAFPGQRPVFFSVFVK